jgi:hypothetical protein
MTILREIRILVMAASLLLPATLAERASAQAQPNSDALAAATELFTVMSADMIGQISSQMTSQLWPLIERDLRQKIDAAALADLRKEFERIQADAVTEAMKEGPPIYARHFSAAELRELAAFYRTPLGQKTLRSLPVITGEIMQSLMPRMQAMQTSIQERFVAILRQRGYIK